MNRRCFLVTTLGAGAVTVGAPWLTAAGAATDDDLAFANFGASVEFLAKDFYTRALDARVVTAADAAVLRRGRAAATRHASALSDLLVGAGDVAPAEEDFAFQWPVRTFRTSQATVTAGLEILHALLGAYQTAGASASELSHRVLYTSLAASVGQQVGALMTLANRNGVEPFPVAMDLEAASSTVDRYLG